MSENNTPSLTADPAGAAPPAAALAAHVPDASIKLPDNWQNALDAEFKDDPSIKHIKDIPTLVKSYINGQKLIGGEKISIPSKHATDDDWKGVFKKLGLPETLETYNLEVAKDLNVDDSFLAGFKKAAHDASILPSQAKKMLDWSIEYSKAGIAQMEKSKEDAKTGSLQALKQEWGQAFEQNITKAQSAFRELATPAELKHFNDSGMGNDPVVIGLFAKIAGLLKEDTLPNGGQVGPSKLSPHDAHIEINKIRGDKAHPYNDGKHPSHDNAVKEMAEFYKYAFPDGQ